MNVDKTKFKLLYDNLCKQYSKLTINEVLMQLRNQTKVLKEEYVHLTIQNDTLMEQNKELTRQNELLQLQIDNKYKQHNEFENVNNQKQTKLLSCIRGDNKGKCRISDFIPCNTTPLDIRSKLLTIKDKINHLLPIQMKVDFGKDGKSRNNQSLGNQIPKYLKEQLLFEQQYQNYLY